MMRRLFVDHPATVGETYTQHLRAALSFAAGLFVASAACLVHALVPALFVKTGSTKIEILYRRMVTHRHEETPGASARAEAHRAEAHRA